MPGFPLMALGAGLGQFAQQYRQQQESAMRQQLAQLALQKQRDEMAGLAAQWSTLLGGGLDKGSPITPVGGGGLPGSGMMPQAAPPPAAPTPSPAAAGPVPGATAQGPLLRSEPPIEREDLMPNAGMSVTGPPGHGIGTGVPAAPTGTEDTIEGRQTYGPAPPEAFPQAPATAATAPAADKAPAADANMKPVLQAPGGQQIDLAAFMNRVSPTELAKRIEAAAPNATPAQKMSALNGLYKIYQSDNKTEQLLLAKVLGFNVGMARVQETGRHNVVTEGQGASRVAQGAERVQQGAQKIAQADTRIQIAKARLDQAKGISDRGQRQAALRSLLGDIDKMIQPSGLNQPPDAETLKALQAQRAAIIAEMNKGAGVGAQ